MALIGTKLPTRAGAGGAGIRIPDPPDPDPFADPLSVALLDLIFERGYEAIDEQAIARRADTSLEEFYRRFTDRRDCTVKTMELCVRDFEWLVESSYMTGVDWQEGLRACAWAAADYVDEHRQLVWVLTVGLLQAKSEMLRVMREEWLMYGARIIERGRAAAPDPDMVPAGAALNAMGSIAQLLTHRMQKGEINSSPHEAVPQLLYLSVRPYLGEEAARQELHAPRPPGSFITRRTPRLQAA
ncbi:MAG TPA: TetR/AcrR family transcriptional regulator [Solirubrobacterales bacterium]|nr:TetR/AcrR family transcriptional regulator [Solirubrobacterales bacterium]